MWAYAELLQQNNKKGQSKEGQDKYRWPPFLEGGQVKQEIKLRPTVGHNGRNHRPSEIQKTALIPLKWVAMVTAKELKNEASSA